jgi:hypothetical protein
MPPVNQSPLAYPPVNQSPPAYPRWMDRVGKADILSVAQIYPGDPRDSSKVAIIWGESWLDGNHEIAIREVRNLQNEQTWTFKYSPRNVIEVLEGKYLIVLKEGSDLESKSVEWNAEGGMAYVFDPQNITIVRYDRSVQEVLSQPKSVQRSFKLSVNPSPTVSRVVTVKYSVAFGSQESQTPPAERVA